MRIVHYKANAMAYIKVGESAVIYPIDHPDFDLVSNKTEVITSPVRALDAATGVFVTKNSCYIPVLFPLKVARPKG